MEIQSDSYQSTAWELTKNSNTEKRAENNRYARSNPHRVAIAATMRSAILTDQRVGVMVSGLRHHEDQTVADHPSACFPPADRDGTSDNIHFRRVTNRSRDTSWLDFTPFEPAPPASGEPELYALDGTVDQPQCGGDVGSN